MENSFLVGKLYQVKRWWITIDGKQSTVEGKLAIYREQPYSKLLPALLWLETGAIVMWLGMEVGIRNDPLWSQVLYKDKVWYVSLNDALTLGKLERVS